MSARRESSKNSKRKTPQEILARYAQVHEIDQVSFMSEVIYIIHGAFGMTSDFPGAVKLKHMLSTHLRRNNDCWNFGQLTNELDRRHIIARECLLWWAFVMIFNEDVMPNWILYHGGIWRYIEEDNAIVNVLCQDSEPVSKKLVLKMASSNKLYPQEEEEDEENQEQQESVRKPKKVSQTSSVKNRKKSVLPESHSELDSELDSESESQESE